jgi:hypothetical protein
MYSTPTSCEPDLRREPQPLRLAAGERLRRAVELEVADTDVLEEHEPLAHFLEDPPPDELLRLRELELVDEPQRPREGHLREAVDREGRHRDGEHLGLPRAVGTLDTDGSSCTPRFRVARLRRSVSR